jgi:FixJ family two-component response regulator
MSADTPIVFVVDDEPTHLAAVARLLRASGFEVQTFSLAKDSFAQRSEDARAACSPTCRCPG